MDVVLQFTPIVASPRPGDDLASDPGVAVASGRLTPLAATVAGTIEVRLWILSWGDDVEVLAPRASATT